MVFNIDTTKYTYTYGDKAGDPCISSPGGDIPV